MFPGCLNHRLQTSSKAQKRTQPYISLILGANLTDKLQRSTIDRDYERARPQSCASSPLLVPKLA